MTTTAPPRVHEHSGGMTDFEGVDMGQRTCSVGGCDKRHVARDMCSTHYNRWQRDVGTGRPRCAITECEKPALKRGWCDMHYGRWQTHGDPEKVVVKVRSVCSYATCDRMADAYGLCSAHYAQRVAGKTLTDIRTRRPQTERDEQGRKLCRVCSTWLHESLFGSNVAHPDNLSHMCKECNRNKARLRNYGLTASQYSSMLEKQGGGCRICGRQCPTGKMLAVDHDHTCCPDPAKSCGRCLRGLLCSPCNQGVGMFGDDSARLRAAADYLDGHRE